MEMVLEQAGRPCFDLAHTDSVLQRALHLLPRWGGWSGGQLDWPHVARSSWSMALRLRRLVLYACIHAIVTLGLAIYAMSGMSERFDGFEMSQGAATAEIAADILMLPGYLLWTSWASKNLPDALEWLLFAANSALWGMVISVLFGIRLMRRR
jgi:hypothetical protein